MTSDDVTVLVTDWLSDTNETSGVNALIPSVPLRTGDTERPQKVVDFLNALNNDEVALGKELYNHPALVVAAHSPGGSQQLGGQKGPMVFKEFVVTVLYSGEMAAGQQASIEGGYTLDAVILAMNELARAPVAQRRIRNTELVDIHGLTEGRLSGSIGRSRLVGVVMATCRVRTLSSAL